MSRRFRTKSLFIACCATVAAFTVACAEDKGESSGVEEEPGLKERGPDESIWEYLDMEPPDVTETRYAEYPAPYEDEAGCKAYENAFPEIHDCACEKCFDIQQQCDALEGCREIAQCGLEIGCSDAYSCYLTPAAGKGQCVPIIDKWGNTGLAAALSLALSGCSIEQACRTITP